MFHTVRTKLNLVNLSLRSPQERAFSFWYTRVIYSSLKLGGSDQGGVGNWSLCILIDRIPSTNEGGCFVRLVVLDVADLTEKWMPCSGGYQRFYYDECFLGDDLYVPTSPPENESPEELQQYFARRDEDRLKRDLKYYPYIDSGAREWESTWVLAALTIGATGWSSGEWRCTYEDLTPEGKAIYDSMQRLYPGREVRLLTYLDT